VRQRVETAREQARDRFQDQPALQCNADMQSRHLRHWCPLDDSTRNLIEAAVRKLGLSARGTDRIIKVARTIADLEGAPDLSAPHVAEAIQYRTLDRMQ
jgi:magnesium chelatase family protein